MRYQGRITQWQDQRGYGFITPNDGGKRVFLHVRAFKPKQKRPLGNEKVSYERTVDSAGRPTANAVQFVCETGTKTMPTDKLRAPWQVGVCVLFFAALIVAALTHALPTGHLWLYVLTSGLAFAAYGIDKKAARTGRWRTRESTLHLLAVAGGWPGALVAQHRFRHKSAKPSFQIVFWLTVLINCSALWLSVSQPGAIV